MRIFSCYIFLYLISISCIEKTASHDALEKVMKFPNTMEEISGITFTENLIFSIQDSGNSTAIFTFTALGEFVNETKVEAIENIDWEAITSDSNGNLYIGDFGNNANDRKDLAIYKLKASTHNKVSEKITFYYPEQTDFPAKKREKLYDCEAFIYYQNAFYLFTKNRSKGFDGTTLLYKIPAIKGNHPAQLMGKFKTCSNYNSCVVTDAAISPDGKQLVLLGHDRIWLIDDFLGDNFISGNFSVLELKHYSQKEGICFLDNQTLLIADEKSKKTGGNLYAVKLASLKNTH